MSEDHVLSLFFFLLGAFWGSFANVVIIRLPRGESIVSPRSHCRSTGNKIPWYDNIPIISYLLLRGRSRFDKSRIPVRYLLVEVLGALAFLIAYQVFGLSVNLIEALVLSLSLLIVSAIDFEHYILPDVFTLSGIVIGIVGAFINPEREWLDAIIGLFIGGGFFYLIALFYEVVKDQEGMGGGDIKLLAWLGAVLGWQSIPFIILASSFLGLLGGAVYAIRSKQGLQTVLPFGPFISFAGWLFLIFYWPISKGGLPPLPLFDFSLM